MNRTFLTPCPYWAEQLAATHPDDLSPSERQALQNHIAICPTCAAVRAEYEAMSKHLSRLPAAEPLPGLPPRLLHLWQTQNDNQVELSLLADDEQAEPLPAPFLLVPRRRRRMSSLVQTLAAVLVVGTLLGSFFVLFTSQHPRSGGPGQHRIIPRGTWRVVSSPNPGSAYNELGGVAAIATNNVWVVGYFADTASVTPGRTLIEHWNGKQWSIVNSPNVETGGSFLSKSGSRLSTVTAVSANDVWAMGFSSTSSNFDTGRGLILHWDGSQWSIVNSPNSGTGTWLFGMARIPGSSTIWAVGSYGNHSKKEVYDTLTAIYS